MAKKELTLEEIHNIDHDALAALVYGQADKDAVFHKKVEKLILKGDQKALIKSIQKDIASIRRGRKFISYYEAFDFAQKIGSIVDDIAMMVEDKKEAAGLFKELILTDSKVYQRSDDSAGVIQLSYGRAEEGWVGCLEAMDDAEIYADIMEMLVCEGFGIRSVFSEKVPQSVLQKIYDEFYERCKAGQGEASVSFDDMQVMQLCAHYLKKPELYIKAAKLGGGEPTEMAILGFAKEYRYAEDAQGVLASVEQIKTVAEYRADEFYELQVWAYETLGRTMDATLAYKNWYAKTKSPSVLKSYLSRLEGVMRKQAREEALRDAQQLSFREALHFFKSLDEVALAAAYIMEHQNALETEYMYGDEFKNITAWLKEEYPQEAVLLYRDSCEKALQTAQSKYYPSAIRALKECIKIENANDTSFWSIETNVSYMKKLLEKHERKRKFVELFLKSFDNMI